VLFAVHLELFGEWCLHGSLQKLDLVAVVSIIIEHLPLLDSTLVHFDLLLADALGTNNLLNPVLVLDASLFHAPVIGDT